IKVPATTEVPKATDIPIRPTETPSTTESPSVPTVVPTDAPTTEPSVVPTPSSTPEVKYDYIGYYGNHKYGYICKQKPSTTQEGIYWATTLDIPDYDGGNDTTTIKVPKLDGYETLDGIECGYRFYEKPTCINEGIKYYYDMRTGHIIKSTSVPATGHTLDGVYYCDYRGYIGRKCKDCDIRVKEFYLLSPDNDQMERYTRWGTKPSTTQNGVLEVYLGKDISKLSADELNKYTKFDIVYDSSCATKYKTNTIYCSKKGYEFNDCDVYAIEASTNPSEYVNSVYFPKYTEVTVKTDHGDKTMIGYYDTEMADDVITYLNEYRTQNGLSELKKSQTATNIAQLRSAEYMHNCLYDDYNYYNDPNWIQGEYSYPDHIRSDHSPIESLNTDDCIIVAENEMVNSIILGMDAGGNIQTSDVSAKSINERFIDSTGHRENMLNTIANGIGISVFVGYYVNNDGTFDTVKKAYIEEDFVCDSTLE
ncbi:MAG: CAP domain-containing protein, partial [Ruminococcus callidus]|nr:CAP domain-containing protein [Ruminococcus callidus]